MDYKILKGREIEIRGEKVLVDTIEEGVNTYLNQLFYKINGKITVDHFSMATQIARAKREIRIEKRHPDNSNLGFFARLLQVYGIFMWRIIHESNTRFGTVIGLRDYGFHRCAFFVELNFGRKSWTIEFVFSDKQEFENGVMPFPTCPIKKII